MVKKLSPEDLLPPQVLNPKELDAAKKYRQAYEAYLDYVPLNIISKSYHMPFSELTSYINVGGPDGKPWREQREEYEETSHREYFATRSGRLNELVNFSIVGIKRALNRSLSRKNVSLKDAKVMSEILGTLDKIIRLDEGRPTDIHEVQKPASLEEVRMFMRSNDPFLQDYEKKVEIMPEAEIIEESNHLLEAPPDDDEPSD